MYQILNLVTFQLNYTIRRDKQMTFSHPSNTFASKDKQTTSVILSTWLKYNMVRIQYFALAILVVFFVLDVNAVTDEQFEVRFTFTA